MNNSIDIQHGRHCVFNLHVHLVFVTKYRKCIFTQKMLSTLRQIFEGVCQDFESNLIEMEGERDHVHLLVNYPPKIALSRLVNSLKGVSSRQFRLAYKANLSCYWQGVLWSPSYFAASCGGAPISIIRQYIEQQNSPP